jgi:hypothetical protein
MLSLGLVLSLSACSPKKNPPLEEPVFDSITLTSVLDEAVLINEAESSDLLELFLFSTWVKDDRKDTTVSNARFTLVDKNKTSYYFGQEGQNVLVGIIKENETDISFYTFTASIITLIDSTLTGLVSKAYARQNISDSAQFTVNVGPDFYRGSTDIILSSDQSTGLKDMLVSSVGSWTYLGIVSDSPEFYTARIYLDDHWNLELWTYEERYYGYVIKKDDQDNFVKGDYYELTQDLYEEYMTRLFVFKDNAFEGISLVVENAIFTEGYFDFDGIQTWMVPAWKVPLGVSESDQFKLWMNMDQWILRSSNIELSYVTELIKAENGLIFTFGGHQYPENNDTFAYVIVTDTTDPKFKEVYQIFEMTEVYDFLLEHWNPAFPSSILDFHFTDLMVAYNDPTELDTGISHHQYVLDETQFTEIQDILSYDLWTLDKDPEKYHMGWLPIYILQGSPESGQVFSIYATNETTVIWVRNIGDNLENANGLWYFSPKSVLDNLTIYVNDHFEN